MAIADVPKANVTLLAFAFSTLLSLAQPLRDNLLLSRCWRSKLGGSRDESCSELSAEGHRDTDNSGSHRRETGCHLVLQRRDRTFACGGVE